MEVYNQHLGGSIQVWMHTALGLIKVWMAILSTAMFKSPQPPFFSASLGHTRIHISPCLHSREIVPPLAPMLQEDAIFGS